jgi:hypothetical protein
VTRVVGIGLVGVGWMGWVLSTSYRRVHDHYPGCSGAARLVVAAEVSEERTLLAVDGYEESPPTGAR